VILGPNGTLTKLRPGTVHVEMSTLDVAEKAALRDHVRSCGGDLLDCPISGTPAMVRPRAATTFVSGEEASMDGVRDVLDAISGPWVYTGAFGTAARLKYVATLLVAVHTIATAEAMVLARRSGLDLELVQRTLDDSIASSAIWQRRGPLIRERRWTPAPGPIATLHEILEQIEDQAQAIGTTLPLFAVAKQLYDTALADGWGALDIAAVHDLLSGESPAAVEPGSAS
jgi:3-hydroxyisobutyrate dehydrogenase